MLGDIIIAEPKAYIAFAGKRVIEQTLRQEVPDGFQVAESLLDHGLLDLIVPRAILKGVLGELFELYKSAPCQSIQQNLRTS
jgi:acetyl-CoA carboxylase carboxyl transferase subunit beta